MPDINLVISKIISIASPAVQRHEKVINLLKELGFDPAQPPKDFEGVYAYSLVEYGVGKPESILKLFREKEIKVQFWSAFNSDDETSFIEYIINFIDSRNVGDEIIQELHLECIADIKASIRPYIEEFNKVFINITKRTRTPAEALQSKELCDKLENSKQFANVEENQAIACELSYPAEFKSLIQDKIRLFCGRKFVFEAFERFVNEHPKGYFTVIGDAGMGKSAIAAKYVDENKAICYFNVLVDGRNRPELFIKSIRQQLINRYHFLNAENDDLSALLVKVSEKLTAGKRLIIVVDALDEVDQEPGAENILYLPKTLPDRVYFLLTRRRYEPSKKRLYTEGVEQAELDLTASQYVKLSRDDIQDYIRFFLNQDAEYKEGLRKWIQERGIAEESFIKQIADKSENNFMYLRYVLPDIARGVYDDFSLKQLPDGLEGYYQTHWVRMGMETAPKEMMVIILFILVEIGTPIPCEMIADIAQQDEYEVQKVLDDWFEYLKPQQIDGDTCYSIYHASFLDFLQAKRVLDGKRKLFKEVNQRIVDYWEREQDKNDAED